MQGGITSDFPQRQPPQRLGFEETELEKRGARFEFGAPITSAITTGNGVAASFGDGTVRFFHPSHTHTVTQAHEGVVLCLTSAQDNILTGGDDGRFIQISSNGTVTELANFGTKWVDCVAASNGLVACSSGPMVHLWSSGQSKPTILEHSSTVGGLTFDPKGKRLAVAHYGGVTLWERGPRRWKSSKLVWKGFHGALTFSPDGKYLITAMQENALHGWRLRDKGDLAMTGYPNKIKSFAWVGDIPHLATSGAEEAICWPFDGKDGPMGRSPVCVANNGKNMVSCVQALPGENAVFTGFKDGAVLLAELDESKSAIPIKGSTGREVTAIGITKSLSHFLIGDAKGQILWTPLWYGDKRE